MAWNLLAPSRPRWTDLPVTATTGTIRAGTGTARICVESGGRGVSSPTNARAGIELRGEITWHIG